MAEHFKYLTHIYENGGLPEDLKSSLEKQSAEIEALESKKRENARLHNERLIVEATRHPLSARKLLADATDKSVFTEEQYQKLLEAANCPYP